MGAYTIDKIENDFEVSARPYAHNESVRMLVEASKKIMSEIPDNQARDFAISHLLQAADMVKCAFAFDRALKDRNPN